jgi:hypothetical protein
MLDELEEQSKQAQVNQALSNISKSDIAKRYPKLIESRFDAAFSRFSPASGLQDRVVSLICSVILSNRTSDEACGLVIAGYGSNEVYPSIIRHETEGFICGKLKVVSRPLVSVKTGKGTESHIFAFAQSSAARLFTSGVDPTYQRFIDDGVETLIPGIADIAAKSFKITDNARIKRLRELLKKEATNFIAEMSKKRSTDFTKPIFDAVDLLDRSELPILAENLVSLTALRQKISLDIETVGGPVDVAMISKHDGFIWIKRKHYFERDLNPFFFKNYLEDPE